jgi:hypothetical protein
MMTVRPPAVIRTLVMSFFVGVTLLGWVGRADAQSVRDPTVPPAAAGLASPERAEIQSGIEPGAMAIIVRDGRPYLAVGTRLYAQGQNLGSARIERISETEVWLREGGVLHKVQQFSGIERRTVTSPSTNSPIASKAQKHD